MATLYSNYDGTAAPYIALTMNDADDWGGQSFTTTVPYSISRVDIYCAKGVGDVVGTITVGIFAVDVSGHPTGGALATGSILDAAIGDTTSYAWVPCTLTSAYNLSGGTKYCIVVHGVSLDATNVLIWSYDDDGAGGSDYANGDTEWSTTGGVPDGWATTTTSDLLFRCYGEVIPASDKTYSKKLVAIGNHEVWYQTDATTMAELTDANAEVNTVNPLTAFTAFQKLFIANKTNLKVADFINSKLTTADISTNPPIKGTILTGGDSGAVMVCDFITASAGAATVYGYRTSTATFTDTETVTGTNRTTFLFGGDVPYGAGVSFVLNADEVASPHWYDWTPYANDTTNFGSMPTSAYISCRYRGRCVLAGHPNYPYQWYMSKVGEPFNWVYGATDPLTAVAGNNADAGEIGDIIRALVPYGDDFLVFGCSTSIHLLSGDPAFSGQIDELDNTTGIFSPWSWCKDSSGNLYFWGTSGIYKMAGGREKPVNISEGYLPKLIDDWAVDPATHRIVLSYDPLNHGIIITRITLDGGTNLNYFYDLKVEGFYPETYPTACGIFHGVYYDSDTAATRGLILASNDGYLRKHLITAKDDDSGASNTAISSYVTLEMLDLNEQDDNGQGKITSLTVVLGGGRVSKKLTHAALAVAHASGDTLTQLTSGATMIVEHTNTAKTNTYGYTVTGAWDTASAVTGSGTGTAFTPTAVGAGNFSDSDAVSYDIHVANDAETCLENIKDGATPHTTGTLTGPGRFRVRPRVRGKWLGIRFYNADLSETFVINMVAGDIKPAGKIK